MINKLTVTVFKNLVGKGHPEFSTKRQQDAQEFFLHLINMVDRNSRLTGDGQNPTQSLSFQVEERIECTSSKKVKYTTRNEYLMALPIPLDKATNLKEYQEFEEKRKLLEIAGERPKDDEIVRAAVPLDACIAAFAEPETIDDFYSTAISDKTIAKKTTRLKTFPDYLMIQLKKFALGDDWVPKKLDVCIDVPDVIDLAHLRGKGLQPNEEQLPERQRDETAASNSPPSITFDAAVLAQLTEMGFGVDACKRALHNTQNAGVEAAVSWLFEHCNDADFNDPFTLDRPGGARTAGQQQQQAFVPDPTGVEMLKAMGLAEEHAILGLKATVSTHRVPIAFFRRFS